MRRPRLAPPVRYAIVCAALALAYVLVPVHVDPDPWRTAARWAVTIAALAAVVAAARWEVARQFRDPRAPLGGLAVAVLAGVLLFALVDYAVAVNRPGEFTGLETRVDALYYAVSTLLTVGFGDISADGQLARGLLCLQMAFNVTVIAGAASLMSRRFNARARHRRPRDQH